MNKTCMFPVARVHCILTAKFSQSFLIICVFKNHESAENSEKNLLQNDFSTWTS